MGFNFDDAPAKSQSLPLPPAVVAAWAPVIPEDVPAKLMPAGGVVSSHVSQTVANQSTFCVHFIATGARATMENRHGADGAENALATETVQGLPDA